MVRRAVIGAAALAMAAQNAVSAASPAALSVEVAPARVCRDPRPSAYLNLDLIVGNGASKPAQVNEVRAFVLDAKGRVIERRLLWQQAIALAGSAIAPGEKRMIFNPFRFASSASMAAVRFEVDASADGTATTASTVVRPVDCRPAKPLLMPITGRVLVYDGHDYLSHHRRGEYLDDWSRKFGLTDNFQRFGVDLVAVDEQARPFTGEGKTNAEWFGWGRPVRAVGDGTVVSTFNDQADNDVIGTLNNYHGSISAETPLASYGNYVLIRHGPQEFSLVGHLRRGSVRVKAGQHVRAGQVIAAVGNSGASGGVHVHFERRTGPGIKDMETLPPYVRDVSLLATGERAGTGGLVIDSGDVLLAR